MGLVFLKKLKRNRNNIKLTIQSSIYYIHNVVQPLSLFKFQKDTLYLLSSYSVSVSLGFSQLSLVKEKHKGKN